MDRSPITVFRTKRLTVRTSSVEDADLLDALWNNGRVMRFVGFPEGLNQSIEDIRKEMQAQSGDEFNRVLIVELKETGERIGQCKLGKPDENGIAETDIKLLPEFWGNKYGIEIKRNLVKYLFEHSDCRIVQATPNVENTASIKMQEAVGGVRVGEEVYEFPEHMQGYTCSVHHYIYRVSRENFSAVFDAEKH